MSGSLAQIQEFENVPGALENGVATIKGFEVIFNNIISTVLAFAGIILFIMLVAGGFRYITAGGDPKNVEAAKKTLTYAIGGIIAIALAFLILRFIQDFTGANVTEFKITR